MKKVPEQIEALARKLAEREFQDEREREIYVRAYIESFLMFGPPRPNHGPDVCADTELYWRV